MFYLYYILNFIKILNYKTRNFFIILIKKYIQSIWPNKIVKQLDILSKINLKKKYNYNYLFLVINQKYKKIIYFILFIYNNYVQI